MDKLHSSRCNGRVKAFNVYDKKSSLVTGELVKSYGDEFWVPVTNYKPNMVLFEWAGIVSRLLTAGSANYRIAGMYLEYENVASPGDTVSPPTITRSRDITYYNGLSDSASKDYLRVPLTATQITSEGGDYVNNQMLFFARSSGTTGVHGKPFAAANNSVIYGASLVSFIDNADATQDLLFSSFYFDTVDQQPKLATSQVGIEWEVSLQ